MSLSSAYVILDGEIVKHQSSLVPIYSSRAAKYGDSFFETVKIFNKKALYFHLHFQRLAKTANLLKYDLPDNWNEAFFEELMLKLINANNAENGKVNIIFSRDTEGLYLPKDKKFRLFMSINAEAKKDLAYDLNEKGLALGEYRELVKNSNFTSTLKTGNSLLYVLASIYSKNNKLDESLIFNEYGRVAECISSNIILVKNDVLITPPIAEYGLDGIMKKVIFQKAEAYGYQTQQYPIYSEDLFAASEVWLCNVVKGLQWVNEYRGKVFENALAKNMISILNKGL